MLQRIFLLLPLLFFIVFKVSPIAIKINRIYGSQTKSNRNQTPHIQSHENCILKPPLDIENNINEYKWLVVFMILFIRTWNGVKRHYVKVLFDTAFHCHRNHKPFLLWLCYCGNEPAIGILSNRKKSAATLQLWYTVGSLNHANAFERNPV